MPAPRARARECGARDPPHCKPAATRPAAAPAAAAGSHALRFPQLDARDRSARAGETIFNSARRGGRAHRRRLRRPRHLRQLHGAGRRTVSSTRLRAEPAAPVTQSRAANGCAPARSCPRATATIEVAPRSLAPVVRAERGRWRQAELLPLDAAVHDHRCQRRRSDACRPASPTSTGCIARCRRRRCAASTSPPRAACPGVLRDGGGALHARVRDGDADRRGASRQRARSGPRGRPRHDQRRRLSRRPAHRRARLRASASRTRRQPGAPT